MPKQVNAGLDCESLGNRADLVALRLRCARLGDQPLRAFTGKCARARAYALRAGCGTGKTAAGTNWPRYHGGRQLGYVSDAGTSTRDSGTPHNPELTIDSRHAVDGRRRLIRDLWSGDGEEGVES